jgi:SRSO17 transposase
VGVVLADAGYGHNTQFRTHLTQLGLQYIGGVETTTSVWEPGKPPLPAAPRKPGRGGTPKRLQRNPNSSAGFGETVSASSALFGLERHRLAARQSGNSTLSFCCCTGATRSSR